jgi:hypothetical protein
MDSVMGIVVAFENYAARCVRPEHPILVDGPDLGVDHAPGLAAACRDLAEGFRQMKAASLLLAEATAELRDLIRSEADEDQ